jgi:hypothetical protein
MKRAIFLPRARKDLDEIGLYIGVAALFWKNVTVAEKLDIFQKLLKHATI